MHLWFNTKKSNKKKKKIQNKVQNMCIQQQIHVQHLNLRATDVSIVKSIFTKYHHKIYFRTPYSTPIHKYIHTLEKTSTFSKIVHKKNVSYKQTKKLCYLV